MIFADKLIALRKKSGWSQEELADQMGVTRQSVSKWEGAQSVPDLEKMVRLSELFGITTDYLLKDELETADSLPAAEDSSALRRVSMEEASAFLAVKAATAPTMALATLLCILSPICLLLLGAMSERPNAGFSGFLAAGLGLTILFVHVAVAVALFLSCGSKTKPFAYLEEEVFETGYGVVGMVNARRAQYQDRRTKSTILGVCLCVAAPILLFLGMAVFGEDELLLVLSLCLMLAVVGIGVAILVYSGTIWESFDTLLQENDWSRREKKRRPVTSAVSGAYWLVATAVFLGYSLPTDDWERSWVIWVIAGVLYPALMAVLRAFTREK